MPDVVRKARDAPRPSLDVHRIGRNARFSLAFGDDSEKSFDGERF
jgi:hypothetical protein